MALPKLPLEEPRTAFLRDLREERGSSAKSGAATTSAGGEAEALLSRVAAGAEMGVDEAAVEDAGVVGLFTGASDAGARSGARAPSFAGVVGAPVAVGLTAAAEAGAETVTAATIVGAAAGVDAGAGAWPKGALVCALLSADACTAASQSAHIFSLHSTHVTVASEQSHWSH